MSTSTRRRLTAAVVLQTVIGLLFLLQFVHLVGVARAAANTSGATTVPLFLAMLAGLMMVACAGSATVVARATRRG